MAYQTYNMKSHYAVSFGLLFVALCDVTFGFWSEDNKVHKGKVGEHITAGCSFTWASNNKKFFCRGKEKGACKVLIETTKDIHTENRYKIEDEKNGIFYVTITGLNMSDSGTYWCGVERYGPDSYQEVIIIVDEVSTTTVAVTTTVSSVKVISSGQITTDDRSTEPEPANGTLFPILTTYQESLYINVSSNIKKLSEETSSQSTGTILFVGVGLLVMITMAMLILCRKRIGTPPEQSNNPVDTAAVLNEPVYEEIREENRQLNITPVNISSTRLTTNIHLMNESRNISDAFSLEETHAITEPPTAELINTAAVVSAEDFYSLAQLPSGTGVEVVAMQSSP